MHRVHIGNFGGADDSGNIQVAESELRRANADGFVGKAHMQRVAVRLAVNGHRADAELLARANHAQGNFAAVGNQDFLEHEKQLSAISRQLSASSSSASNFWGSCD